MISDADEFKEDYEFLVDLYKVFCKEKTAIDSSQFFLSRPILFQVVSSYYHDLTRYQVYSGSSGADNHKRAAYTMKWISKLKPIQLLPTTALSKENFLINPSFALFAGFSFLDETACKIITPNLFQHLMYSLHYRPVSGKQLALSLYILEQCGKGKNP